MTNIVNLVPKSTAKGTKTVDTIVEELREHSKEINDRAVQYAVLVLVDNDGTPIVVHTQGRVVDMVGALEIAKAQLINTYVQK